MAGIKDRPSRGVPPVHSWAVLWWFIIVIAGSVLRIVSACSFDYSVLHCRGDGELSINCSNNFAIRILSARKRKLKSGTCAEATEESLKHSCYSESSAYSTVAQGCNAQKSCSIDVSRTLSYGNTGCDDHIGDYILHLIFRCEPPALPDDVAWTKSICSTQPDPLPWAYIHSQMPNTVSPFIDVTDCSCQIGVPANVEVQIQPKQFRLTKYGTWCGQKLIIQDGAESREFCSQLYDPFIMPCWNTYRYLTLSFRNNDNSILTHFNVSIWATTGEQLEFHCGIVPTTTSSTTTTPSTTSTTSSVITSSTTLTPSTTTPTTTTPTTTTTTQSTTTTQPTTTTTTQSTSTTTTPTTTQTTTTQPTSTTTTTTSITSSTSSSLSSTTESDLFTTTSSSTTTLLPTTDRDENAIGGPRVINSGRNTEPSLDEARDFNAIIVGGAAGGLILLVIIVTAIAIGCARLKSRMARGGAYPADTLSTEHIYEEPTYETMPYDPEPPTMTRIDPQRGTMTVGNWPPPSYPPPSVPSNGGPAQNPMYVDDHRESMLFAY